MAFSRGRSAGSVENLILIHLVQPNSGKRASCAAVNGFSLRLFSLSSSLPEARRWWAGVGCEEDSYVVWRYVQHTM